MGNADLPNENAESPVDETKIEPGGRRFVGRANTEHELESWTGSRVTGLILFALALFLHAGLFSLAFLKLQTSPFSNPSFLSVWIQLSRWWPIDPNILWPIFASTIAMSGALLLSPLSSRQKLVVALAIIFPAVMLLFQLRVIDNYPAQLVQQIQGFGEQHGLEQIREMNTANLVAVLILCILPVVSIAIATHHVVRPWWEKMKQQKRQATSWILASIAVSLLLLRYAAVPYQSSGFSEVVTRSMEMRMLDGFVFGFYAGFLSLAIFVPVRLWVAMFFSFVVVFAGNGCELLFFPKSAGSVEGTLDTVLFPVLFWPTALLLRLSADTPIFTSREGKLGLALAVAPAVLLVVVVLIGSVA